jgi:hypothetical protein
MDARANLYHLIWFDPGAAATGWGHVCVRRNAFSRPENKVLANILTWQSGELKGPESGQLDNIVGRLRSLRDRAGYLCMEVGTEEFDLVQTIGGKNLLSPVRINAVLDWEVTKLGLKLRYQNRSLRINQTRERLKLFGFNKRFGKDEFAAMQHLVYRLRKIKEESRHQPWKLGEGSLINAHYDCRCENGKGMKARRPKCDLIHPR